MRPRQNPADFLRDWGATTVQADLNDSTSLPAALVGIHTVIDCSTARPEESTQRIDWEGKIALIQCAQVLSLRLANLSSGLRNSISRIILQQNLFPLAMPHFACQTIKLSVACDMTYASSHQHHIKLYSLCVNPSSQENKLRARKAYPVLAVEKLSAGCLMAPTMQSYSPS